MPSSLAAVAAAKRLVPNRLRVIQRDFLTRRGGRANQIRSAAAIGHSPSYIAPFKADVGRCPRVIDAEAVHGDEQQFWTARRNFYRGGISANFYPLWDRQAQVLIMMTRNVARVPQEAAFRLFALGIKVMLLPRVVAGAELMLPSWLAVNAEALLTEAGGDRMNNDDHKKEKEEEGDAKKEGVAAAAVSEPPAAAAAAGGEDKNKEKK